MDPNMYSDSNPTEPNLYSNPTGPNMYPNPTEPNLYPNSNPTGPNMYPNSGMYPNPTEPNMYPAPNPNAGRGTNRRLLIIIGVLSIVLLGLVVAAIAVVIQRSGPATASVNPTPTVASATTATVTTKPRTRRIVGVIQSINQQSFLVVPQNKKKPVAIMLTSTTKYKTPNGQGSFSNLQVGQTVQVNASYNTQSGTWDATRVTISPVLPTPTTAP